MGALNYFIDYTTKSKSRFPFYVETPSKREKQSYLKSQYEKIMQEDI